MSWFNNDKLLLKFGTEKVVPQTAGEYRFDGPEHMIELKLTLSSLTQVEVIQSDTVFFPKSARITKLEVIAETAAATGVAIDLGFIRASDRTTEIDYDGLLAAYPLASMDADGETNVLTKGSSFAGALVGATTSSTQVGHISCSATTATAFTAGVVLVRIYYHAV